MANRKSKIQNRKSAGPWDVLDRARDAVGFSDLKGKPPAGSFNVMEYAERYGMTRKGASSQLTTLVANGTLKSSGTFGPKRTKYYQLA